MTAQVKTNPFTMNEHSVCTRLHIKPRLHTYSIDNVLEIKEKAVGDSTLTWEFE